MALTSTCHLNIHSGTQDETGGGFDPTQTANMISDGIITGANTEYPVLTSATFNSSSIAFIGPNLFLAGASGLKKGFFTLTSLDGGVMTFDARANLHTCLEGDVTTVGVSDTSTVTGVVFSLDYSVTDTYGLATNGTATGAGSSFGSATVNLHKGLIGNVVRIMAGTNATAGRHVIVNTTNGSAVFNNAVTTGATSNIYFAIGGAGNRSVFSSAVPGNTIWIKANSGFGGSVGTVSAVVSGMVGVANGTASPSFNSPVFFPKTKEYRYGTNYGDEIEGYDNIYFYSVDSPIDIEVGDTFYVPTHAIQNTTSNNSWGRITTPTSTSTAPVNIIGYTDIRGDKTDNKPILFWDTNGSNNYAVTCQGVGGTVQNIAFFGARGLRTLTNLVNTNGWWLIDCDFAKPVNSFWNGSANFKGCWFTDGVSALSGSTAVVNMVGCTISDSGPLLSLTTGSLRMQDCIAFNNTGPVATFTGAGNLIVDNSMFYGFTDTQPAFSFTSAPAYAYFRNSHFENCTDYAIKTAAAYPTIMITNCSSYNNTPEIINLNHISFIENYLRNVTLSASPFKNPAIKDFRLNATGRSLKDSGDPDYYPGMIWKNYASINPTASGTKTTGERGGLFSKF